jgi:hypothetical protein
VTQKCGRNGYRSSFVLFSQTNQNLSQTIRRLKMLPRGAICPANGITTYQSACTAIILIKNKHIMKSMIIAAACFLLSFKAPAQGFIVLELFTSEGCSSCPPAEELLADIQAKAGGQPIYALAYHVDYWDRLGWKDAFSSHAFSERQYYYSNFFSGQVYTPQLVMNGITQCIGTDATAISRTIKNALADQKPVLNISGKIAADKVILNYKGNGQPLIAFVQKHATISVKRGENEGRTLSHVQIVRELRPYRSTMSLPTGFNPQDWEMIALLQNNSTGGITAAGRVSL